MGLFRSYAKFKIFQRIWHAIRGRNKNKRTTRNR